MAYLDGEDKGYAPDPAPQVDNFPDQLAALYAEFGRTPTAADIQIHRGNPGGLDAIRKLLEHDQPAPAATTTTTTGGGGGGGGGGSLGSLISPYMGGSFQAPAQVNLGGPAGIPYIPPTPQFHAPGYTPPPAFSYESFKPPTGETVLNEPGFKFGLDQGLQGLEQSSAARGVLNGGGTLKDVAAWANNYGSQKYGDAYSREASTYGMNRANAADIYSRNYQTQYADPYQHAFEGAQAEFAPQMQGYATQAAAGQRANEFNYGNAYNQYQDEYKRYLDQQNLLYNYRAPFLRD